MTELRGDIDTTYHTQQRDMFSSGLAAEIGVHAFAVWHAIKAHSDFNTGESWPSIRRIVELTGCADKTVQAAIKTLVVSHLLRVSKKGQKNLYVARERMDVRVGDRVICTVVVDFVPSEMRDKLAKLKAAGRGDFESQDVWAQVDLIPAAGMKLDATRGVYSSLMRADEVPTQLPAHEAREALKTIADQMRVKRLPKK
jgi:DNA-binding transcriptional regulator YhcF (GntR family)